MSETLRGETNRDIARDGSVEEAIDAAQEAGRNMYSVVSSPGNSETELVGGSLNDDSLKIVSSSRGRMTDRIDAHASVPHPENSEEVGKSTYHGYRDERYGGAQGTHVERRDKDGNLVYEGEINNPRAVKLVAQLAAKRVVRFAKEEKARQEQIERKAA